MIDSKKGNIMIKNIKYNYFLFNINDLIILMKNNKKLINSFEEIMVNHQHNPNYKIDSLIKQDIKIYPKNVNYFFLYKNNEIISCIRLSHTNNAKSVYFDMIHTNIKYRNQGFCKITLGKLLNLLKNKFKIYNLKVKENNIPAIKCYENFKFFFIKKEKDLCPYCNTNIPWNIMKLKI